MAATGARHRKHSANPCSVKEDAGSALRFSGIPSSSSPRLYSDGTPRTRSAASGPDQATLSMPDHEKLLHTHDSPWWLHSRHHIGNQKDFINESPKFIKNHHFDESSHCKKAVVCEDLEKAHAECVTSDENVGNEELNQELNSNAQNPSNKNKGESWYMDGHLTGLEQNCLISEPKTLYSDLESQLAQAQKTEPWWRMTDKDELASMVAQKSLEHIENCDLPRPQTKDFRKGQIPSLDSFGHYKTLPTSLDWTIQTGFSGLSNHHQERTTSNGLYESQSMLSDIKHSLADSDSLLSCKDFSTTKTDHGLTQSFPGKDPSKAQLLEALCHFQTRAREAEEAAQKANDEKEHIITLFFRQASHLFAYKQWLRLLQLENFSLQLNYKNQPISTLCSNKGMQRKKGEHKVVKQKHSSTNHGTDTMPFCEVGKPQSGVDVALNNGIQIFYRTYGRGPTKVLLIIGLAATHEAWGPQIKGLTGIDKPNDDETITVDREPGGADNEVGGIEVCAFDNRGVGRSSIPTKKSDYS
ncbi:hypothetical protein COLO4_16789 [Corchorus olitorius]|uniref:Uncharacterized protein n=1 Tax=Corchorus olitorius TaxID=93759 RepID=A0A1R3JFM7_9ROSI|nr:hypothetical protein COLO4_16789 [Corchorus olitorius]